MRRRLIVIGTSAGGIEALRELVALLPSDLSSPIAVVMHSSPHAPGIVHDILSRAGQLPAVSARNGERLRAATSTWRPPDFHLLVEPDRLRVSKGPKENRFRPAIDPLFRSAAQVYGPAAVGVILTGNLDDGTAGLWAIKKMGGVAIVQDPDDAMYRPMPQSALHSVAVDYCVPLREIAPLLVRLTSVPVEERTDVEVPEHVEVEVKIANEDDPLKAGVERLGAPSAIACPECHGVLRQWTEGGRLRFRCHTGHAYSPDSLVTEIDEATEIAMWNAIRSLQEGSILMRQLAAHADNAHGAGSAVKLTQRADELERRADALRDLVQAPAPETEPTS